MKTYLSHGRHDVIKSISKYFNVERPRQMVDFIADGSEKRSMRYTNSSLTQVDGAGPLLVEEFDADRAEKRSMR